MALPESNSKHQYSLRRLICALTVLSVVFAISAAYPVFVAEVITVNLLLCAPALLVLAIAVWNSKNPRRTLCIVLVGIFVAWFTAPRLMVNWGSYLPTFWDRFKVDFDTISVWVACGAVIAAGLDAITTLVREEPSDDV